MGGKPVRYRFGAFELDPGCRTVRSIEDGQSVALTAKVFDTLLYLIEHRGQLVEKSALLEAVWPKVIVEDANLTQTISMLRRALGDDPHAHRYIATVPGRGYQFVAEVELGRPEVPSENVEARATGLSKNDPRMETSGVVVRPRVAFALVALVVVAAALSFAPWLLDLRSVRETALRDVLPDSVAVLPFQNLGPDSANAALVSAIHRELINALRRIGLNAIARGSVVRYIDGHTPINEIAAELRVETVMQGSIRYANDRLRVTAELLDGETGARLWRDEYGGNLLQVAAIQSEIAEAVAEALGAEVLPDERTSIETRPTENPAAYEWYLRAVDAFAGAAWANAINDLDRAIAIDADFAAALGLKAAFLAGSLMNAGGAAPATAEDSASLEELSLDLATKALRLDAGVGTAWGARALIHTLHWRWSAAEDAYSRAVALGDPGLNQAQFKLFVGDHETAVRMTRQILDLDPTSAMAHWLRGWALGAQSRHEESLAAYRDALRFAPTEVLFQRSIGYAHVRVDRYDQAERAFRAAEHMLEGHPSSGVWLPGLAYGYAIIGLHDDAARLVRRFEVWARDNGPGAGDWAFIFLAKREEQKVLDWLTVALEKVERRDLDAGFWALMGIKYNILGDPMLEQPEFVQIRSRIRGD